MSEDIDSFIKHQKAKLAAERDTLDNATSPRENVSFQHCVSALGVICTPNFTRIFIKDVTYNIYFDYFDGISVVLAKGGKALCYQIICLTSLTRAKPKEKNEICRSISTRAVKCDGVFFLLQHGFRYGFQHT